MDEEFSLAENEFPPLPATPSKSPVVKKTACEVINSALVGDIHSQLSNLTSLINSRSDAIEGKICDLNDKVERVCTELKDVSMKMAKLEKRIDVVEHPVKLIQKKSG